MTAARRREPYQSPAGTYERIRKSVLEDPDPGFTLAERVVLLYAATKPDGWALRARQIADALGPVSLYAARTALAGLHRKGYTEHVTQRDSRGVIQQRATILRRGRVIAGAPQLIGLDAGIRNEAVTCDETGFPQVTAPVRVTSGWDDAPYSDNGNHSEDGKSGSDIDRRPDRPLPAGRGGADDREYELAVTADLAAELLRFKVTAQHRGVIAYLRRTIRRSGRRDITDFAAYARLCFEREPDRWFALACCAADGQHHDHGSYGYIPSDDHEDLAYEEDEAVRALLRGDRGSLELWTDNYATPEQSAHAASLRADNAAA